MTARARFRRARRLSVAACLVPLALSCGSKAESASAAGSHFARFESAHFLCRRSRESGPQGNRPLAEFEVWMRGDRAHVSARSTHVLLLGKDTYSWSDERPEGLKLDLPPADERTRLGPSVDYVHRAAPCRDRGKQNNKGTVDGHPFVSFQCHEDADDSTRTYYFATDLQDFPIRARIEYPDRSVITYLARSLEVPASIPDSKFELPPGITFQTLKVPQ
jgi:hypothetical protein